MNIFNLGGGSGDLAGPGSAATCSRKACRADASWQLLWNNPKIHTPEREKIWTACEEHRRSLSDFLDVRGFLRRVDRL